MTSVAGRCVAARPSLSLLESPMKIGLRAARGACLALLALATLGVSACSGGSSDATIDAGADTGATGIRPGTQHPDAGEADAKTDDATRDARPLHGEHEACAFDTDCLDGM